MDKKYNVLVFSGAPFPAIQICNCLKYNIRFHVMAASSYENHSDFVFQKTINGLPFIWEEDFVPKFKKVLEIYEIDFVIPTDDSIALMLAKYQREWSAILVCSDYATTKICRNKRLTYQTFKGAAFMPYIYEKEEITKIQKYPVFLKPNQGEGSRGVKKINSLRELKALQNLEDYVICEYLPGEEYTVDCFTNRYRELLFYNPRCRSRITNGITARGYDVEDKEEFLKIVVAINQKLKLRGYWFIQLKRDKKGNLKLLEICTRFSGSFGISKAKGVNLPLLALCDFAQMSTDVIVNNYKVISDKTYMERYCLEINYDTVYVDYDDTITCKDGDVINPYVIAFLYQCKGKGKKIRLLTRHFAAREESLEDSFQKLGVSKDLFDEIIELDWKDFKYKHIEENSKSIFLDNSFAERKQVKEKRGIPVFDVCNIDCLFDWR